MNVFCNPCDEDWYGTGNSKELCVLPTSAAEPEGCVDAVFVMATAGQVYAVPDTCADQVTEATGELQTTTTCTVSECGAGACHSYYWLLEGFCGVVGLPTIKESLISPCINLHRQECEKVDAAFARAVAAPAGALPIVFDNTCLPDGYERVLGTAEEVCAANGFTKFDGVVDGGDDDDDDGGFVPPPAKHAVGSGFSGAILGVFLAFAVVGAGVVYRQQIHERATTWMGRRQVRQERRRAENEEVAMGLTAAAALDAMEDAADGGGGGAVLDDDLNLDDDFDDDDAAIDL